MASPVSISFSSLSQSGSGMFAEGGTITEDGFTFASGDGAFDVWEVPAANLPGLLAANTSLFEFFAGSTTTLTDGGSVFTLNSVDLAPVITAGTGSFTVGFTGMRADLSTVSQTFTAVDGTPPALQTFVFSGFNDLVKVTFTQGTNMGFFATQDTAYQFDNLLLTSASVPEPSSGLLLIIGLICLAAFSIKRTTA
jgi:hypothetical protein